MKIFKATAILAAALLCLPSLSGCRSESEEELPAYTSSVTSGSVSSVSETFQTDTSPQKTQKEVQPMEQNVFYITAGNKTFTAVFAENSSAEAFRELLSKAPLTVHMSDYGNFEKVGDIGSSLPRNDERIVTVPGDVILYQGSSVTIYYDENTWDFTRLGRIENVTRSDLLSVFGKGDVEITFSLVSP